MIPVVNIKWDEAVNPPPKYQVIRYRKTAPADATQKIEFLPLIDSGQPNYTFTDNSITVANEAAYYNKIWIYRVVSKCANGDTTKFNFDEYIKFSCNLLFNPIPHPTMIDFTFYHMGGDINRYIIKIFDDTGVQKGEITRSSPFAGTGKVQGTFVGLTPNKTYTIIVYPTIQGTTYQGECEYEVTTTVDLNTYSIEHVNAIPLSNIKLSIGNNNTTPTTVIYNAGYSTSILTGPLGVNLVNANVKLEITGGNSIGSIKTCNAVDGSLSGSAPLFVINWTGMNGNLLIRFSTILATIVKISGACTDGNTNYTLSSNTGNSIVLRLSYGAVANYSVTSPTTAKITGLISSSGATNSAMGPLHTGAGVLTDSINVDISFIMSGPTATVNTQAYLNNITSKTTASALVKIVSINGVDQPSELYANGCDGISSGG